MNTDKAGRRACLLQINLPPELIQVLVQYLYYTPEQAAIRERHKRVHYCIKNARHINANNYCYESYYYLFNYKFTMIYICFCKKCGDYKFSPDMEYCVICKCS